MVAFVIFDIVSIPIREVVTRFTYIWEQTSYVTFVFVCVLFILHILEVKERYLAIMKKPNWIQEAYSF